MGRSRRRLGRLVRTPANAPVRPASDAGRLARRAKTGAAETRGSRPGQSPNLAGGPLSGQITRDRASSRRQGRFFGALCGRGLC